MTDCAKDDLGVLPFLGAARQFFCRSQTAVEKRKQTEIGKISKYPPLIEPKRAGNKAGEAEEK